MLNKTIIITLFLIFISLNHSLHSRYYDYYDLEKIIPNSYKCKNIKKYKRCTHSYFSSVFNINDEIKNASNGNVIYVDSITITKIGYFFITFHDFGYRERCIEIDYCNIE